MTTTVSQHFFHLVQQGIRQLEALCLLSDEEKRILEVHDSEELIAVIGRKRDLLGDFADNVNARNQRLHEQGFTPDPEGLEGFLGTLGRAEQKAIGDAWKLLEHHLAEAARLNERNEQIVLRSQKHLDQLLRILRGQDARTSLYTGAGTKGNYSAQNILGKA